MKKKIGVIMYQNSFTKGQEIIAQSMVKGFKRIGTEAYLITGPFKDYKRVISKKYFKTHDYRFYKSKFCPTIRVDGYLPKWPHRRVNFYSFQYVLRKIVNRFDLNVLIIHSNNWNGPLAVSEYLIWNDDLIRLKEKSKKIFYCYMPHYQSPDTERYDKYEIASRKAWNKINLKNIFNKASLILNVTPLEKRKLIDLGADNNKCYMYPNGVDDIFFEKYKNLSFETFENKYGIPKGKKIITYIGTLEERKNPINILKVAKGLQNRKDIFFIIAGANNGQREKMDSAIKKLRNLKYVGKISEKEKVELIKGSYLNLILSKMELFGIVQLEFMYFGVPVITSAVGGQKWLIKNNVEGIHLHGPDDIDGAINSIIDLVENPEIRNSLGKNSKIKSKKFFRSLLIKNLSKKLDEFKWA